jgi:DNA-binding NarL/FixJ family response regulator
LSVSAPEPSPTAAVVVAGDEETRVLLRGLLRLHHFRVDGEAEGATEALELIRHHRPGLLVVDVNLAEGSPLALLTEARKAVPSIRTILVAPTSRPPPPSTAPVVDVVLLRPFRIRQFAEALTPGPPPSAGAPSAGTATGGPNAP